MEPQLSPLPPLKTVCGFRYTKGGVWQAMPQTVFKPRGLAIWGTPTGALLQHATIGNRQEADVSLNGIPAKFFGLAESYAQLATLVAEGKEPPAWCDWSVCYPGCIIRLTLTAYDGIPLSEKHGIEVCMWGESIL